MGDALTEAVIGAAIEVHLILGPGLLEQLYEEAIFIELDMGMICHPSGSIFLWRIV